MFADKLIIQVLEKNGELATTIIRDSHAKPLLVDYPRFGRERKEHEQAFSIISDQSDLEMTNYIKENLDKSPDFKRLSDGTIEFHQEWINIPIDRYGGMGLYCFIFPEYAALTNLDIHTYFDDYNPNGKVLLKDPDFNRYLLYLRLKSEDSHCSFNIRGKFFIDDKVFSNSIFEPSKINFICDKSSNFGKNDQNSHEINEFQKFFKALGESNNNPALNMVLQMAGVNLEVGNLYNNSSVENTMSETKIEQNNSSIGVGVNQGKIETEKLAGTINEAQSQNLAEAAAEIQSLLKQLSETNPTTTSREKNIVVGEAVDQIENNPTLKAKVINALKAGGTEAFKEAVNHPLVNILVATIEGWQQK